MSHINTFTMPDGRKVTVDFTSTESCLAPKKSDKKEIHRQLHEALKIACSQLTGEEVFNLLRSKN